MYFRFATFLALLSAPLIAIAAQPNAFKIPQEGIVAAAGKPTNLEWTPTTDGTVSLVLRSGLSVDLNRGVTIASHITNDGSFTWIPSATLPRGSDYTIEIVDDADPTQTNYTPPFVLDTSVLASTTITSGSSSSTTGSSTTTSGSSTTTGSSSTGSSTGTMTKKITTGSSTLASTSGITPTGVPRPGETGASFQPTQPSSSKGAAARATTMAELLGVAALGALAL